MSLPDAPPIIPGMPYTVVELEFGPFKRPVRLYPNGHYGDILTDDELATWRVIQGLISKTGATLIDPVLTAAVAEYAGGAEPTKPTKPKKRR